MYKKATIVVLLALLMPLSMVAQQMLTLDSCRAMALRNNKQISIAVEKRKAAQNVQKAARASYLPRIDAAGTYMHTSKEISLLRDDQKSQLSNIGTNTVGAVLPDISTSMTTQLPELVRGGVLTQQQATYIGQLMQGVGAQGQQIVEGMNSVGQGIVDALRTDTRNVYAGSVMMSMPLYSGGRIVATNRIADLSLGIADETIDSRQQTAIYDTDKAYWTIVSLCQKQRLANQFVLTLRKLHGDVLCMVKEGVATHADALQVSVKLNEAEMLLQTVDNGLSLARMHLCQLCGLDLNSDLRLADEATEDIDLSDVVLADADMVPDTESAINNRPEIKMLEGAVGISRQTVKMARSLNLPQLSVAGGYTISNPNVFNSFQKKFSGMWSVGAMLAVPLWNWGEGVYRVRAAKAASNVAAMELDEARELLELQVSQSRHRLAEARNRLGMATRNIAKADENLRCADLGYREGVVNSTTLLEAQTAWLQAETQKIDAQIDVRMSYLNLRKALGQLTIN